MKECSMKKQWKKPVISKILLREITLSGTIGNVETKANGQPKQRPS
jgi:hypothetical protein